MRLSRLAVLPLLVLGLTACGDKSGGAIPSGDGAKPAAASGPLAPCNVITLERAKKLIGDDARPDQNDAGECSYNAGSSGNSVTAHVETDQDGTQWDLVRKIGGEYQAVSGVGDEALFRPGLNTLWVRKGKNILDVQIVNGPASALEPTKQLATEILR